MYATAVMSAARCGHLAYELPLPLFAAIAGPSVGRRGSFCAEWDGVSAQRLTACTQVLDQQLFCVLFVDDSTHASSCTSTLLLQRWLRAYRTNDNTSYLSI